MKFEKATKVKALIAMIASILTGGVAAQTVKDAQPVWKWSFDADRSGEPPSGFSFGRTGSGRVGRWVVRAEKDAPSGTNVLAQVDEDNTSYRFPIAVANEPSLQNLRLSVRCKPISGKVDQACGLVFRYRDENNYYVTRANALEDNIRLYYVLKGKRVQIGTWDGRVTRGSWHELRVDVCGDQIEIYWDGKKVIDARDTTFGDPGKVGAWTKADSATYFDDLTVTAFGF
jgi:hypothetical protein